MKVSFTRKYAHLDKFKGVLHFNKRSSEKCIIIHDGKILGEGVYMQSTGKEFKVKFASKAQEGYASKIQGFLGRVGIQGRRDNDTIFVTGCYRPLTKFQGAKKIHRIREARENEESMNRIKTGAERSGDVYKTVAMESVVVEPPKKEVKARQPRKRVQKNEVDEFELMRR